MPATTAPHPRAPTPHLTPAAVPTPRHRPMSQSYEQPVLTIRDLVPKDEAQRFIADALHDIRVFMQEQALSPAGPPFSVCRPRGDDFDIEAGWPTARRPLAATSRIHSGALPRSITGPQARPSAGDAAERGYALEV